jgi:GntR family transcriptional regulator
VPALFNGPTNIRVEESVSARMPSEPEARTLRIPAGVPVFVILRRTLPGDTVLKVSRHIVIPADRVVLEYGIDVATPDEARELAGILFARQAVIGC